jgi:hypothetical protein
MSNEGIYHCFEEPQQITHEKNQGKVLKVPSPSSTTKAETEVVVVPIDQGVRIIIPESKNK